MFRLTVVYPSAPEAHFDFDYYVTSHIPMVASLIGDSVIKTEVAKGIAGGDGGPAPYHAIGHLYLTNLEGLQAAFAIHLPAIAADLAKYTNIAPVINIDEIIP